MQWVDAGDDNTGQVEGVADEKPVDTNHKYTSDHQDNDVKKLLNYTNACANQACSLFYMIVRS